MMQRRKAETLVEFLMAAFIFAEIMTGVLSFIANQTQTLVNIHNRDTMMFHVQRFRNMNVSTSEYNDDDVCKADNVTMNQSSNTLIVSKGKSTMTIELKP